MTTETQAPDPAPLTIYISRVDAETLRSRGRCTLTAYTERVGNESNEVALTAIPAPEGAQALSDEQDAFEADFMRRLNRPGYLGRKANGYGHAITQARWDSWQARAALAAPPTDNNSMGKSGCFPAAERTNAAPQAAPLPDIDLCRLITAHEVYQYHPGALHEFSHAVIAEFCRVNGIPAPKEPTNDR